MLWAIILAVCIGASTILQGGFNRQITPHWDLATITLFNALVYIGLSVVVLLFAKKYPAMVPELLRPRADLAHFSWLYLLPGLCGFLIVIGMPVVILKIGAFKMILIVVTLQLIGSLIWDMIVEGIPFNWFRLGGALLAFAGVLAASVRSH